MTQLRRAPGLHSRILLHLARLRAAEAFRHSERSTLLALGLPSASLAAPNSDFVMTFDSVRYMLGNDDTVFDTCEPQIMFVRLSNYVSEC